MHTPFDFATTDPRTVYVKAVAVSDLPTEMQANAEGRELFYAVHDAEGEQLALVADRKMAFVLARQNDFSPVPVH
ncbi:DUF1150 family protein [Pseudophaeobacter sp.]|uniref:DUF1150 family protein n=1 Tax=Pseudophaeobacter sp. TaxID=1971739 RepID=UPI0040595574